MAHPPADGNYPPPPGFAYFFKEAPKRSDVEIDYNAYDQHPIGCDDVIPPTGYNQIGARISAPQLSTASSMPNLSGQLAPLNSPHSFSNFPSQPCLNTGSILPDAPPPANFRPHSFVAPNYGGTPGHSGYVPPYAQPFAPPSNYGQSCPPPPNYTPSGYAGYPPPPNYVQPNYMGYGPGPAYGPGPGPGPGPVPPAHLPPSNTQNSYTKKALIIGINYSNDARTKLKGAINDANCMEFLIKKKFGYTSNTIVKLTDDSRDPKMMPTRRNILNALAWLMKGTKPGDKRWFSYSGHGSQTKDLTGDEDDGYDETILPCDWRKSGMIIDDELHDIAIKPTPRGVHFFSLMDCCHSGTGLDLPYVFECSGPRIKKMIERNGLKKGKQASAHCILVSGCSDSQTAADTQKLGRGTFTGATTYAFIQTIEKYYPNLTYESLIRHMHNVIKSQKFAQTPQLSAGHDLNLKDSVIL